MKIFNKNTIFALLLGALAPSAFAADYGIPAKIQDGNILHCFDWKLSDIKADLPKIAGAGFGAVQISPMQRNVSAGTIWYDVYRPYDFTFVSSTGLGNENDLRTLCSEAEKYGIKIIVDVVMNHVDGTPSDKTRYHDAWWNGSGRLRWEGNVNYGNRNSITHGQLGGSDGYPDVNSENQDVADRAKAYIEQLKNMGVKGIRFDAAKHIGLPSEGCNFWPTVTSVPDMYYYGEILGNPGGNNSSGLMKEYAQYICVTDDEYGNGAMKNNGVPSSGARWANGTLSADRIVYWGESHDTYSNDPPYGGDSKNVSQAQVDRAYAIVACRNGATALYFSRPAKKASGDIKIGVKGSDAYNSAAITAVNKFRNKMNGKADYFSQNGKAASVTRQNGGAVIVAKTGYSNVSIANGGGYCPPGTYMDRISGNTFTVTSGTISGQVGASGIAVLYDDGDNNGFDSEPGETDRSDSFSLPVINGVYLKNIAGWEQPYVWAWKDNVNLVNAEKWPGDKMVPVKDEYWMWEEPAGKAQPEELIFNPGGDDGKTTELSYIRNGVYDNSGTLLGFATGEDKDNSGIEDDAFVDGDSSEPIYFNLQGVRVENPSSGIYIKVQGSKSSKVLL